jgi:gas vesicle protein
MFRKLFLAVALSVCAVAAFALPKPSEVKAAVASGNYAKAESMLLEVMKEKPSAKAHYDLGQVYTFEGKHKDALNEFRQAQALDPSLKFASSATEFTKKLATAQALVAPPPVVVAQSTAPAILMPTIPQATSPAVQHDSGGSGGTILVVLLLLLVGGGAVAFFLMRKKTSDDLNEKASAAKESMNFLLGHAKSLEDATLIAKTATYPDAQKRRVLDRIAVLQSQVRNALADLKDGKEVTANRMATIETNVMEAVDQATNGVRAEPAQEHSVEVAREYTPRAEADLHQSVAPAPRPMPTYTRAPSPTVIHHHHSSPSPAPIVQNNSGMDLLTGVLIGQAISHPTHERTVYVERAPILDTPRYERDSYEAPAPAPTFDVAEDSKDDYVADAPSVDSAPADNDSY